MRERARGTPAAPEKKSRDVQLADNRRAFYDYSIGDKIEAGLALTGTVVACPRHGFLVDVTSGQCPTHSLLRVRTFPVTREGDTVRVAVPPRAP